MRGIEESLTGGGGFAARNEALGGCNNGGDGEQKGLGFGGRKGAAAIKARRGWGGAAPALPRPRWTTQRPPACAIHGRAGLEGGEGRG